MILGRLLLGVGLAQAVTPTPRPTIAVPDNLAADYFRQAWIIESASARQLHDIQEMTQYCKKNESELKRTRNEEDQVTFVCVPKGESK